MPSTFTSVVNRFETLSNDRNKELIHRFVTFMNTADFSEKYRKDNLYVGIIYAEYLGDKCLSDVASKQDIIDFLDTRRKDTKTDPDQKWIRTWNDYQDEDYNYSFTGSIISGVLNCYHELVERKGEVHSECSGLIIPVSENIIKTRSVYDTSSFIADNETIYGQ